MYAGKVGFKFFIPDQKTLWRMRENSTVWNAEKDVFYIWWVPQKVTGKQWSRCTTMQSCLLGHIPNPLINAYWKYAAARFYETLLEKSYENPWDVLMQMRRCECSHDLSMWREDKITFSQSPWAFSFRFSQLHGSHFAKMAQLTKRDLWFEGIGDSSPTSNLQCGPPHALLATICLTGK